MITTSMLNRYRSAITAASVPEPADPALLIERSGSLACHYAPFEHINPNARVVLLGMTPGTQQANNALQALRAALDSGNNDAEALAVAKATGSFSGAMRNNLVALLDAIGLHEKLGISTCADLFGSRTDLVHFTSALRYPVFLDGKNYQGSPSILATPFLRQMSERWLAEEVRLLKDAFWVPLGKEARSVLMSFAEKEVIARERCLDGLPHPSGANSERIAYFLGTKPREALSSKTEPDKIEVARRRLIAIVQGFPGEGPATASALKAAVSTDVQDRVPHAAGKQGLGDATHLLDVWAYDKDGHKVHPYRGKAGAKKGLYSVNFTNDTRRFEAMDEEQLIEAITSGRFRTRGTIRMCRATASSGTNAFAPVIFRGQRMKDF